MFAEPSLASAGRTAAGWLGSSSVIEVEPHRFGFSQVLEVEFGPRALRRRRGRQASIGWMLLRPSGRLTLAANARTDCIRAVFAPELGWGPRWPPAIPDTSALKTTEDGRGAVHKAQQAYPAGLRGGHEGSPPGSPPEAELEADLLPDAGTWQWHGARAPAAWQTACVSRGDLGYCVEGVVSSASEPPPDQGQMQTLETTTSDKAMRRRAPATQRRTQVSTIAV